MEHLRAEEQSLARKFYEGIRAIEGIQTYGDFSTTERCPILQ